MRWNRKQGRRPDAARCARQKEWWTAVAAGALSTILLLAATARGQAPAGPLPPKPGAAVQQAPQDKPIRVRVNLVNVPVTVRTSTGDLFLELAPDDFKVFDNGVEQKVEGFGMGGEKLSITLVFETSSRIQGLLPAVRKAGILYSQSVVAQTGEASVIGFDDTIRPLLQFSSEQDQIEKTIEKLPMGTSGARLYDAMSVAIGQLKERPADRRRVMLITSEAVDTGSELKLGEVLREAQLENITIYSVALSELAAQLKAPPKQYEPIQPTPPGTFGLPPQPGTIQTPSSEKQRYGNIDLLAAVALLVKTATNAVGDTALEMSAAATGGTNFPTFRERTIENAIQQVGNELNAQYVLSYRPTGTSPEGYHEIKVDVARQGLVVTSRPGYYLPGEAKK